MGGRQEGSALTHSLRSLGAKKLNHFHLPLTFWLHWLLCFCEPLLLYSPANGFWEAPTTQDKKISKQTDAAGFRNTSARGPNLQTSCRHRGLQRPRQPAQLPRAYTCCCTPTRAGPQLKISKPWFKTCWCFTFLQLVDIGHVLPVVFFYHLCVAMRWDGGGEANQPGGDTSIQKPAKVIKDIMGWLRDKIILAALSTYGVTLTPNLQIYQYPILSLWILLDLGYLI